MEHSWSVNIDLTKDVEDKNPVWALDECQIYPVLAGQLFIYAKTSGRGALVAESAFRIVDGCKKFEKSSIHIKNMMEKNKQLKGMRVELEKLIDSLRTAGILLDSSFVLDKFNGFRADDSSYPTVQDVYIATCDRPEALKRLLGSIVEDLSITHKSWNLNVVDDSRDEKSSDQVKKLVDHFNNKMSQNIRYIGAPEVYAVEQYAHKNNPDIGSALNFLLWGDRSIGVGTYGAAWNRALLLSKSRGFIKIDDDVLFKICVSGAESKSVRIGKSLRTTSFLNQTDWDNYLESGTRSILDEHSRFLGQSIVHAVKSVGGTSAKPSMLIGQPATLLTDLDATSRIVMTSCGYIGDPGTASNQWLLGLADEAHGMLVRSEGEYVRNKCNRNLMLGQNCYALETYSDHMSGITGIDNTLLLPPYFPIFRNEDFLFGKMVQFLYPGSVVMDQPWMVPHLPLEPRKWAPDQIIKPRKMGMLFFIGMYIEKHQSNWQGSEIRARYSALIEILKDLQQSDDSRLISLVHEEMSALAASAIYNAEKKLAEFSDAPGYWKNDVQASIESNMKYLSGLNKEFLVDLKFAGHQSKAVEVFRYLLSRYIRALEYWPEIRESMKYFNQ